MKGKPLFGEYVYTLVCIRLFVCCCKLSVVVRFAHYQWAVLGKCDYYPFSENDIGFFLSGIFLSTILANGLVVERPGPVEGPENGRKSQ